MTSLDYWCPPFWSNKFKFSLKINISVSVDLNNELNYNLIILQYFQFKPGGGFWGFGVLGFWVGGWVFFFKIFFFI